MPRLKNKPIVLDEGKFVDWLLEVYYYRFMDQGMAASKTPLLEAARTPESSKVFLEQVRSQLLRFELTFPLAKLPGLYAQAMREISTYPARKTESSEEKTGSQNPLKI